LSLMAFIFAVTNIVFVPTASANGCMLDNGCFFVSSDNGGYWVCSDPAIYMMCEEP
jgi:hypothetical protein